MSSVSMLVFFIKTSNFIFQKEEFFYPQYHCCALLGSLFALSKLYIYPLDQRDFSPSFAWR
jgi:hypothetical protein